MGGAGGGGGSRGVPWRRREDGRRSVLCRCGALQPRRRPPIARACDASCATPAVRNCSSTQNFDAVHTATSACSSETCAKNFNNNVHTMLHVGCMNRQRQEDADRSRGICRSPTGSDCNGFSYGAAVDRGVAAAAPPPPPPPCMGDKGGAPSAPYPPSKDGICAHGC